MTCKCALTGAPFEITKEDKEFYDRLSPVIADKKLSVPLPTFSPQARLIRRMSWRNDRTFYKRKCDMTGEPMVAIYPEGTPFPVYHPTEWWSDRWDPESYGQEFFFDKPFFEQWYQLMLRVPRLGVDIVNCENSDYCNYCGDDKSCYLDIAGEANEDCYYNLFTKFSKDCADCTFVYNSELAYESINCYECHDIRYGYYLENCSKCDFCFDLKGCNNCIFSSNLRHKDYHIHNKPVSKEEYQKALEELRMDSYSSLQKHIDSWKSVIGSAIHRDMYNLNSEECTGDNIKNSKNCKVAFNVSNSWDCKYLYDVLDAKNCYDLNYSLYNPEVSCELISTLSMKYSAFCMASHYCHSCFYCDQCNNSSNLFGCIGMNQKKYCILNKQYSQDEYEALVPRIVERMREDGEWGEFFPYSLSPWGYNETVAQEYYPFKKEDAVALGFSWRDAEEGTENQAASLPSPPESISKVEDTILKETLKCSQTGKLFRVVKPELKFYRRMGVPVPRLSPDTRHLNRLGMRNPRKLYNRKCDKSGADIITTYPPNAPEKVYCEEAYLEVVR